MKANELRYGNLFNVIYRSAKAHLPGKEIFKIVEIRTFDVKAIRSNEILARVKRPLAIEIKDLSPIPLTEEILLKAGFEKDLTFTKKKLVIWFSSYKNCFTFRFGHDSEINIEYVHQLQNLYLDLNREELNIEL